MKLQKIGEPSWRLQSDRVDLAVTRQGGHMAPVVFDRTGRRIQPFHIAPFWKENWIRRPRPTPIRYVFGVTHVPRGFTKVHDVLFEKNGAVFISDRDAARAKVDWRFAQGDGSGE